MLPMPGRQVVVGGVKHELRKNVGRYGFVCPLVVRACGGDIVGGHQFFAGVGASVDGDIANDGINGHQLDS